ncbi:MAG: flavin-containing monooxygenase, partial [Solirubrobacteraceae bacterium]
MQTLILGAGVSGLAVAAGLKRAGKDDFVIIDRAGAVGGTWHLNRYPGCAVDIPSHLYSYSFALNPDWSRTYAEQPELEEYIGQAARRLGLLDHVSLGTEMLEARWDAAAQRWEIGTSRGLFHARFFVIAAGPLHDPVIPELPGLATFRGEMFHSANWPRDADRALAGRRVA